MGVREAGYPFLYGYGYPAGASNRIPIHKIKNRYGYVYPPGDGLRRSELTCGMEDSEENIAAQEKGQRRIGGL